MIKAFYKIEKYVNSFKIHYLDTGIWYILKYILNVFLPVYYRVVQRKKSESSRRYLDGEVIVSLTTFPGRFKTLPLVLESIFRQTVHPDRYILWLSHTQFKDKNYVESYLKKYINYGLEIRYCDDLKAHKKYFYTMQFYPNAYVVTVDDDILLPDNMLETLLLTYKKYPNCIVTQRAHEMKYDSKGILLPYGKWNRLARGLKGPNLNLCATGGAGCLYFPGCLSKHVFDKKQMQQLCFGADDIWLKCMSFLNGTPVVLTGIDNPEILDVFDNKDNGLARENVEKDLNDLQLENVTNYYRINWGNDYGANK